MRNHRNLVASLTLVGALLALGTVGSAGAKPGPAASTERTARMALVGPDAALNCADLEPATGEDASEEGPGSVVFHQNHDGTVDATVRLRALPDTSYFVHLFQVGDGTCPGTGEFLTTNGKGFGTVTVTEDLLPGSTALQVLVEIPESGEPPYYRASDRFLVAE